MEGVSSPFAPGSRLGLSLFFKTKNILNKALVPKLERAVQAEQTEQRSTRQTRCQRTTKYREITVLFEAFHRNQKREK